VNPAYRERVAAGGCRSRHCTEQGLPEFAVWWKCPAGHREECRYCAIHGPHHFELAVANPSGLCKSCGEWAVPVIEGLPTAEEVNADPEMIRLKLTAKEVWG
jgi:hypothetical protein